MPMSVCHVFCGWVPTGERGLGSPGAGITDSCGLPDVGAETQTQLFCKRLLLTAETSHKLVVVFNCIYFLQIPLVPIENGHLIFGVASFMFVLRDWTVLIS